MSKFDPSKPLQTSFLHLAAVKPTRISAFLDQMQSIVPWDRLVSTLEPHFPHAPTGRPRLQLERMLRCLCLQQWFNLSDPALEHAIHDRASFQRFLKIDPFSEQAPDHSSFCRFRKSLTDNELFSSMFQEINLILKTKGLLLETGTLVDATLVTAPSSTKNLTRRRDPEMSSTKKGNTWHFGMKLHVGVDPTHACVHTVKATTAKVHDSVPVLELVHARETFISGDKAYASQYLRESCEEAEIEYRVLEKERGNASQRAAIAQSNREKSKVRSRVEWPFRILKDLWGHRRTRYKGIKKNEQWLTFALGLVNLYQVRNLLLSMSEPCCR